MVCFQTVTRLFLVTRYKIFVFYYKKKLKERRVRSSHTVTHSIVLLSGIVMVLFVVYTNMHVVSYLLSLSLCYARPASFSFGLVEFRVCRIALNVYL